MGSVIWMSVTSNAECTFTYCKACVVINLTVHMHENAGLQKSNCSRGSKARCMQLDKWCLGRVLGIKETHCIYLCITKYRANFFQLLSLISMHGEWFVIKRGELRWLTNTAPYALQFIWCSQTLLISMYIIALGFQWDQGYCFPIVTLNTNINTIQEISCLFFFLKKLYNSDG